ncbi:MAG: caspase family protein [Rubrivivax sp.]|nr:caspase family protein [Rubrivivax sp.]
MNRLAALAAAFVLLLLAPLQARSADCPDRYRIAFADGARSCLTDHALANDDVVGQFGADLRRVVPSNGYYSVAATPSLPQCKRSVGVGVLLGAVTATGLAGDSSQRSDKALTDCRLRNRGASADCQCRLVLVDGRSPLTAAQFAAYAERPAALAAAATAAATPAPGTAAATPPPAPPAARQPTATTARDAAAPASPSPPAATAAGARPDATATELAELRAQLDSLRDQVARTRPAAGSTDTAPAKPRRARALVIGNGRYTQLGALPNPPRDAQAIAAKLRGYGIEVDLYQDVDRSALVRALTEFQKRATGYDVNLFFYAGHGLQVGGINYIVPVDMTSDAASVGTVKLNTVSLDDALDYLPAGTRVVFLDACRDNPLSRSLRSTRSGAGTGLAPVSTVSGTLLSYATRDGSTAEDGSGRNSPYTTALLQHLDAPEDIALVLRRVRQAVLAATGQRQEPWEYGSLVGDQLVVSRLAR